MTLWPARIRAIVEAARAVVRTADEFPPEEVGEGNAWAGGEALQRLNDALEATGRDYPAPYWPRCRGCEAPSPSDLFKDAEAAGWWFTPPRISPTGPDAYCPECRTLLREAVRQ